MDEIDLTGLFTQVMMLADDVRMAAFRDAIHSSVQPGDVVVDIGSGMGVLALMALRAGAARVYAIEFSPRLCAAIRHLIHSQDLEDRIQLIEGDVRQVELPERVDVVLCELLGNFGLDENFVEITVLARDRFLKPQGRLIPGRLCTFVAPVEYLSVHRLLKKARESDLGLQPLLDLFLHDSYPVKLPQGKLLAPGACLFEFDPQNGTSDTPLIAHFETVCRREGYVTGLGWWFAADLGPGVRLTNDPAAPSTHWTQSFLPLREAFQVRPQDRVSGSVRMQLGRSIDIDLDMEIDSPAAGRGDSTRRASHHWTVQRFYGDVY
jgi:protein arginine N-methyltransferase 1